MSTQNTQTQAVETAELISALADQLAAVVDSMEPGRTTAAGLDVLRDRLGEIHVESDQLAQDIRELVQPAFARYLGVAA
ncbi:MAG: hypothetical protein ACRDTJ_10480 [Pseudonocardiaceae bacterium]